MKMQLVGVINPEIADQYLQDWLFYRTVSKMLKKLSNTEWLIKCKLSQVTSLNLLDDVI